MNTSAIRPIKPEDLTLLQEVIEATELFPPELLDVMLSEYFNSLKCDDLWLTYDEGQPVSVAYCAREEMTNGTWNVLLITVHPNHQGKGIGGQMLAYIEDLLASRGERLLLVETSGLDEFSLTRAFYQQNGYQQEARIRDFYQAGDDKIIFRKNIATDEGPSR